MPEAEVEVEAGEEEGETSSLTTVAGVESELEREGEGIEARHGGRERGYSKIGEAQQWRFEKVVQELKRLSEWEI